MSDKAAHVTSSHVMFCGPDGEWKPLGYIDSDSLLTGGAETSSTELDSIKIPSRVSMQITMEPIEGSHPAWFFFLVFPEVRYLVSEKVYRNPKMKPLLKNGRKP